MELTINQVAETLLKQDNITILIHKNPDGDCIGSGYALCRALRQAGKKARVRCSYPIPKRYAFLTKGVEEPQEFTEQYVVSTDVAGLEMLGSLREEYEGKIDLCIDHHRSPVPFSTDRHVEEFSAACGEIILLVLKEMGTAITDDMARCLYTALCTDTGCFRYSNTTPRTLRLAAELMEYPIEASELNVKFYENKSHGRILVETEVLQNIRYFADGKIAVTILSKKLREEAGVEESELEDISTISRAIEGVLYGITIREEDGESRVSLRSAAGTDSAAVCKAFGGGGHIRAAGCTIKADPETAAKQVVDEVIKHLD